MSSTNQFNGRDAQGVRKTHLKQGIDDVFFHLTVDYHFKRLLRVMPENIKQKFRQAAYGLIHPIVNIRFLNVVNALDRKNPSRVLDNPEIQLLEYVMQAEGQGERLLVGDLISLDQYGSQATLHGRLKNLVALGFIRLVTNTDDCRKKSVLPTKLTLKYAQFMSDCLKKSLAT